MARHRPLLQKVGSTPEQRAAFREAQKHWMQDCREEAESLLVEPEESAIWDRIMTTFEEASWIELLHQFPNGKPLLDQDPRDLRFWQLAIGAMHRHAMHGAGSPDD